MRIVSLLPSTTEIVFALGLADQLVAVTHECDYPPQARALPVVTQSLLDHSAASSAEIDGVVRSQLRDDLSIYALDSALMAQLAPTLILTQALCDVCAVSFESVERAVVGAPVPATIMSFEPNSLDGILGTILAIGNATARHERAYDLVDALRARIERVRTQAAQISQRPRVAFLEWFDPPFGPGHWIPEMIELVNGRVGFGKAGDVSQRIAWESVIAFAPEVIILAPCGFDLARCAAEAAEILPHRTGWSALPAVRQGRVYAVDGNAYFSRPGPRIVDSLELLAEIVHPDLFTGWGPVNAAMPLTIAATGLELALWPITSRPLPLFCASSPSSTMPPWRSARCGMRFWPGVQATRKTPMPPSVNAYAGMAGALDGCAGVAVSLCRCAWCWRVYASAVCRARRISPPGCCRCRIFNLLWAYAPSRWCYTIEQAVSMYSTRARARSSSLCVLRRFFASPPGIRPSTLRPAIACW
ncbi:cobalamin-binding protein [Candidatus Gracilibacteria bacterium]|nr:cobalamin-binding protein [Candidatus Gracilibacteria bacterium]